MRKSQSKTFMNGEFSVTEKTQFAGGINIRVWIVSSATQDSWNRENIFTNVNLVQKSTEPKSIGNWQFSLPPPHPPPPPLFPEYHCLNHVYLIFTSDSNKYLRMKIFEMMQHNIHDMDCQLFEELFSKNIT